MVEPEACATHPEKDVTSGGWSDYIFANGKRTARTTSAHLLHIAGQVCANCGFQWYQFNFTNLGTLAGRTIQAGDSLHWVQWNNTGSKGGLIITFTDGTESWMTGQDLVDQNGEEILRGNLSQNLWEYRAANLSPVVGKTISQIRLSADNTTLQGQWDLFFQNLVYTAANGAIWPLFSQNSTMPGLFGFGSSGMTQTSAGISDCTTNCTMSDITTYNHGDQIGSSRLLTGGNGYPVWQATFLPYGEEYEPQATSNHYKFTGKERDNESGLDYFGARYYSNGLGRFVSADLKRFALRHLLNPQKLNKYTYVLNNPLALIDPDGLEEFRVFVHFNPGDPAPKNSPNWSAIQANAQEHGNTVKVFQGDAANSQNYQSSLASPGTTVFIGHTQLVDNGAGPKVAAVSLSDKEVGQPATKAGEMGAGRTADPPAGVIGALPTNIPAEMPTSVNGGTVAIFGCDSTGLATQYPGAGTFVGVDGTPSTDGLLNAGGAFVNSAASGNTVGRAVTDANGQINQIPNLDKNAHVQVVPKKEEPK